MDRICPICNTPVKPVVNEEPTGFTDEEFAEIKVGDWYCDSCPPNDETNTGFQYFKERFFESRRSSGSRVDMMRLRLELELPPTNSSVDPPEACSRCGGTDYIETKNQYGEAVGRDFSCGASAFVSLNHDCSATPQYVYRSWHLTCSCSRPETSQVLNALANNKRAESLRETGEVSEQAERQAAKLEELADSFREDED